MDNNFIFGGPQQSSYFCEVFFFDQKVIRGRTLVSLKDVVYGFDGGSLNPVENTSVAKFVKLVML